MRNSQLWLINAAHEHFITEAGKKSKTALKKCMVARAQRAKGRRPMYGSEVC